MHGRNGHNAFKVDYTSIFMKYFVYLYYVAVKLHIFQIESALFNIISFKGVC